jgi:hypothetical protein
VLTVLEGSVNKTERSTWEHVTDAAGDMAEYYPDRLTYLCWKFR